MDTSPFSLRFWTPLRMSYLSEQPWQSFDICRILRSAWTMQGIRLDPTHPFWVNSAKILISILLLPAGHLDRGWIRRYYWGWKKNYQPANVCVVLFVWVHLLRHCGPLGKRHFTRSNTHKCWLWKTAPFCSLCCGGEGEHRQIGEQLKAAAISLQQSQTRTPRLPSSQELSPPRQLNPGSHGKARITTAAGSMNGCNYSH